MEAGLNGKSRRRTNSGVPDWEADGKAESDGWIGCMGKLV